MADYIDTPKNIRFEVNLKHKINEKMKRLAIGGIHRIDSKGLNLIQIVDLFLGAVVYEYKMENKLVTGDKNKIKVMKLILKKLKRDSFLKGSNRKRFKIFKYEYNKKGPSS